MRRLPCGKARFVAAMELAGRTSAQRHSNSIHRHLPSDVFAHVKSRPPNGTDRAIRSISCDASLVEPAYSIDSGYQQGRSKMRGCNAGTCEAQNGSKSSQWVGHGV